MSLYELIIAEYPELADSETFYKSPITLRDDADGTGAYISEWNYKKPVPESLKQYVR